MRLVLVLANLPLLSVVASENIGRPPTVLSTSEPDEVFVEAVIVGAGWAGISAAIDLQNSGHSSLLILEANDYVGGRSKSENSDGTLNAPPAELPSNNVPIDMGSEWLYQSGRPESQYSYLRGGGYLSEVNTNRYSDESLALGKCGVNSLTSFYWQTGSSPGQSQLLNNTKSARIDELPADDTFTPDYKISNKHYMSPQGRTCQFVRSLVDDLTTSSPPIGVGFGNTAAAVAEQLKDKIRLNSKVIEINTSSTTGKVIVTYEVASSGSQVRVIANSVAVTVSLNVLKANNINFVPQLPSWKQDAINGMGMGASLLSLLPS
ncbi:hypothetical protein THAOC_05988, partial [Thalassiosira oceanica]